MVAVVLIILVAVALPIYRIATAGHPRHQPAGAATTPSAVAVSTATTGVPGTPTPSASIDPMYTAPQVGGCYAGWDVGGFDVIRFSFPEFGKVACVRGHSYEVVTSGSFLDLAQPASSGMNPDVDRGILAGCEKSIDDFLGGDWRSSWVLALLLVPGSSAWASGQRWYACAVAQRSGFEDHTGIDTTGTLRDALRGSRPARITCADATLGAGDRMNATTPVPCGATHLVEFAGVYRAPAGDWPGSTRISDLGAGCADVVARYLGFPSADANTNAAVGVFAWPPTEEEWKTGLRDFRCLATGMPWPITLVGSVKGIRGGKPHH